jgi:methionine-rich copper-binding protein CopC
MSFAQYIITALLAAALSGCAGNGKGLDANGDPIGSGSSGSSPLTADFQSIQDNVFTPICTKCHAGAGAPEGLQLDAAHSYSLLVGVASAEQSSVERVEPGDPDSSYIIRKLEGLPGITGGQMPLGGPYLPQSTIDIIKQWIMAGAQDAPAATSLEMSLRAVQHFGVTSTAPDDTSVVSDAVQQIVIAFNADIDSTLLINNAVTLTRVDTTAMGSSPTASVGGVVPESLPISTTVPTGDPSAIVIKPQTPLSNGTYRVTLQSSLANMNAQALSQDYSFTFTVDVLP